MIFLNFPPSHAPTPPLSTPFLPLPIEEKKGEQKTSVIAFLCFIHGRRERKERERGKGKGERGKGKRKKEEGKGKREREREKQKQKKREKPWNPDWKQ